MGSVAIPLLVRTFRRSISRRVVREPVGRWAMAGRRHVPLRLSLIAVIRGLQALVVLLTALSLLVI